MSNPSDDDRFSTLVECHQAALFRYARRRVAAVDAADVVAEVFAAAWRHRDRLPDPVEPWLYRTAWNALLHQFRGARRHAALVVRLHNEREPHVHASEDHAGERIRAALARLRPIDQELLRLAYWEELDAAQIAYIVGGTPASVRVRLHRARKRLAARLAPADPEGETAAAAWITAEEAFQ